MKLRVNDVYQFQYHQEIREKLVNPYWCFDGQLVVRQNSKGEKYLEDTYWNTGNNRRFTLEEALEQGTLRFICNLDEVESITKYEFENYYDAEDTFDLSHQHGHYPAYFKKKGAKISIKRRKEVLKQKIEELEIHIENKQLELKRRKEDLARLENREDVF